MILKIFLFWRLGLFFITYLGSRAFPQVANSGIGAIGPDKDFDFWASWVQWDGGHYLAIAQNGYFNPQDYAFFPLYPLLVRALSFLVDNLILSGLIISNLAFIAFLYIFHKLLKVRFTNKVANTTVTTFIVFPTTFFAVSFYSESLFLLLAALVFLFLNNKNYLFSSVVATVASLTKLIGITLAISIAYSYLSSIRFNLRKIDRKLIHVAVAFFGFALYSIFLFAKLDDPIKYLTSQSLWQREVTDPISTVTAYFWGFITGQDRPINDYLDVFATLSFLTMLILGSKRTPSSWWMFSMLAILIPASTGTLTSMPRYLLASLGVFVILGQYLETHPKLKIPLWAISLILQAILAVRFINGYWVA